MDLYSTFTTNNTTTQDMWEVTPEMLEHNPILSFAVANFIFCIDEAELPDINVVTYVRNCLLIADSDAKSKKGISLAKQYTALYSKVLH